MDIATLIKALHHTQLEANKQMINCSICIFKFVNKKSIDVFIEYLKFRHCYQHVKSLLTLYLVVPDAI
jgi:hypothetical protein